MLNNTNEKLDDIKKDLGDVKDLLCNVRAEQAKCDSRWSLVSKISAWLFSGLGLSGVIGIISNWGHK